VVNWRRQLEGVGGMVSEPGVVEGMVAVMVFCAIKSSIGKRGSIEEVLEG
jgi:hypothetical protein